MASGHAATPNSECDMIVNAATQRSQSTVPSQLAKLLNGAGNTDSSQMTKIVSGK